MEQINQKNRYTGAPSFVVHLESVTDVKIIHQTVLNEVVDITIRVVDFVGGDIDNPEIKDYPKLVFVATSGSAENVQKRTFSQ